MVLVNNIIKVLFTIFSAPFFNLSDGPQKVGKENIHRPLFQKWNPVIFKRHLRSTTSQALFARPQFSNLENRSRTTVSFPCIIFIHVFSSSHHLARAIKTHEFSSHFYKREIILNFRTTRTSSSSSINTREREKYKFLLIRNAFYTIFVRAIGDYTHKKQVR